MAKITRTADGLYGDTFEVDLSVEPYNVRCPACGAYALAPCRSERRKRGRYPPGQKPPGRVLREPHGERWELWREHPEARVTILSTVPKSRPWPGFDEGK